MKCIGFFGRNERAAWLGVVAWSVILFLTVPLARGIQTFVDAHWGCRTFTYAVLSAIVLATGTAVPCLRRVDSKIRLSQYLFLLAVAVVYAYLTFRMRARPEEAVHFIEYGILGLLVFNALRYRISDPLVYFAAIQVGAIVGNLDEVFQWLTPRRVFDYRDVWVNTVAGILMQTAIAGGFRPMFVRFPVRCLSLRLVIGLALLQLALLGLCLSNTPWLVDWYSTRVSILSYLRSKSNAMSEYGHRYSDADIGVFYSRFSLDNLKNNDRLRAGEAARILDAYHDPKTYEDFLKKYTPVTDPFLHEARVHLFRRDHYLSVTWKHKNDPKAYRYHMTVAYRENQILEKYFGETLHRSRFFWKPDQKAFVAQFLDPSIPYISEVSADLITGVNLREMWRFILSGLAILMLVYFFVGKTGHVHRSSAGLDLNGQG